jgi:predicted O-methyltransferase YrrM
MKRLSLACGCLFGVLAASFCQSPPPGALLQEPQAAPPARKAKKVWTNDDFPERRPPPAPPEAPQRRTPREPDVAFVPTPMEVVDVMLQLANLKSGDVLYDLGSGDGRIVIAAAQRYGIKGVGVDIDPVRIKEARENARKAGVTDLVTFHENDLFQEDISKATVVTLYLLPGLNLKLRPKLLKELKPGSRVVSHNYDMGRWAPERDVRVGSSRVFHWVIPADASAIKPEPEPQSP